jgi:mxaJ protein
MTRRSRRRLAAPLAAAALAAALLVPTAGGAREGRVLRVCADPNNLPFTNARLEGFENRLADLVARDLDAAVVYTWWAQRRSFLRNTLGAAVCDLVVGVRADSDAVLTTRPYYRSAYAFVSRRDRNLQIRSLDDPTLARLRIGVQLVGDDGADAPPAHALARRGLVDNVVRFSVPGDYAEANLPARIVEAVAAGEVDVAIAWGPRAGYFARRQSVPLEVVPVADAVDRTGLPLAFDIAMGVRKGDAPLRDAVQRVLDRRRGEIEQILDAFGVPRV